MRSLGVTISLLLLLLPLVAMGQQKKAEDVARETFRKLQWEWKEPLIVKERNDSIRFEIMDTEGRYLILLHSDLSLSTALQFEEVKERVPLNRTLKNDEQVVEAGRAALARLDLLPPGPSRVIWPKRVTANPANDTNRVRLQFFDMPRDLKGENPTGNVIEIALDLSTGRVGDLFIIKDWSYGSSKSLVSEGEALQSAQVFLRGVGYRNAELGVSHSAGPLYLVPTTPGIETAAGEKYRGRKQIRPGYEFTFGRHTHVQVDGATGEVLSAGLLKSGGKGPSQAAQATLAAKVAERPNHLLLWVGGPAVILSSFAFSRRSTKRP